MDPYGLALALQSIETDSSGAPEHAQLGDMARRSAPFVPVVEVAFPNDMWWSMPEELSEQLVARRNEGQDAVYTWDWGRNGRTGSWSPDGASTSVNRYAIDFQLMVQTNIDNGRQRSIRIIYVRREDVTARRGTGQLPER